MAHSDRRELAASKIQRAFRSYLKDRYKMLVTNWDDLEVFDQTPVHMIPKYLLVDIPTHGTTHRVGYNAINLGRWLLRFPVDPITRTQVNHEIFDKCVRAMQRFCDVQWLTNRHSTTRLSGAMSDILQFVELECKLKEKSKLLKRMHTRRSAITANFFAPNSLAWRAITAINSFPSHKVLSMALLTTLNKDRVIRLKTSWRRHIEDWHNENYVFQETSDEDSEELELDNDIEMSDYEMDISN